MLLFILQGLTVHALPILKLVFGRRFDRLGFSRFDGIVVVLHQLSGLLPGEVPEFLFTLANRIAVLVFTDDGIHLRSDVIQIRHAQCLNSAFPMVGCFRTDDGSIGEYRGRCIGIGVGIVNRLGFGITLGNLRL